MKQKDPRSGKKKRAQTGRLSPSLEMYLKTIASLEDDAAGARVKAISETLGVRMPSVTEAILSLKEKGLVKHSAYGEVILSQKGRAIADDLRQRYAVTESFLSEVLGIDRKLTPIEACRIEHDLESDTVRRLKALLDFLRRCPMDVEDVLQHFQQFLKWREAGQKCPHCERAGDCPETEG